MQRKVGFYFELGSDDVTTMQFFRERSQSYRDPRRDRIRDGRGADQIRDGRGAERSQAHRTLNRTRLSRSCGTSWRDRSSLNSSRCSFSSGQSSRELQWVVKADTDSSALLDELYSQPAANTETLLPAEPSISEQATSSDHVADTEAALMKVGRRSMSPESSLTRFSWDYPLSREEKKWRLCQLLGREQASLESENGNLRHTIRRLS